MNFELTSGLTQFLFILLAISATIFVLLFWNKIYRRGFLNLIFRTTTLLLIIVLTISSLAISVNKSQGFYSSWTDFFGGTRDFTATAITNENLKILDASFLKKAQPISGDLHLLKETIRGKKSHVSNIVYLILPSSAVQELKVGKSLNASDYQVVEFLTGFPSQPEMWFKALKVEEDITAYNATHSRKIIGVIPQINIAGKADLECMNFANGQPDAEAWLTEDMHSYISRRLGLADSQWISVGVSTGAWCAAMFAIRHPKLYSGALSIAGYYRPALPLKDPIDLQRAMIAKYDVKEMESRLVSPVPLYIVASLGDVYSIRETTRFLAKPHPMLKINYREISSGGHNPRVWKSQILPGLTWLSTVIH